MTKLCLCCGVVKPFDKMAKSLKVKDGVLSLCISCKKEKRKADYKKNSDRYKQQARAWYQNNRIRAKNCRREYYNNNKESFKEKSKTWKANNRKKVCELDKIYRMRTGYNRVLWERNKQNPSFRLKKNLRSRFNAALKNNTKISSVLSYLGCDLDSFRSYLESKFSVGMDWNNYGKWHLDHIVPCSHFDFGDQDSVKKCWNFTNLQPLWAKDNILKADKIIPSI